MPELIIPLIEANADLNNRNSTDPFGKYKIEYSLIFLAIEKENLEALQILLDNNVDLKNAYSKNGVGVIFSAIENTAKGVWSRFSVRVKIYAITFLTESLPIFKNRLGF